MTRIKITESVDARNSRLADEDLEFSKLEREEKWSALHLAETTASDIWFSEYGFSRAIMNSARRKAAELKAKREEFCA